MEEERERRLSATLHRYYVSEVKPVRFGIASINLYTICRTEGGCLFGYCHHGHHTFLRAWCAPPIWPADGIDFLERLSGFTSIPGGGTIVYMVTWVSCHLLDCALSI